MKSFNCTLETTMVIEFSDEAKIIAFFVNGTWRESFYHLQDLEDIARHLSFAFHQTSDDWDSDKKCWYKFVEGFGEFYNDGEVWRNGTEEYGEITVRNIEDLDVAWVDESK